MAARMAHRAITCTKPSGRLVGRGWKNSTFQGKHSLAGEEEFVTIEDHNNAIHELEVKTERMINDVNNKFKNSLLEQSMSMDTAMLQLKCDLKKDLDDKDIKHSLDHEAAKNELKIMKEKFEAYKLTMSIMDIQGSITRLKNYGWGIGAGTAFLARFSNIPTALFKTNGKVKE